MSTAAGATNNTDLEYSLHLLAESLIPTLIFMVSGIVAIITGALSTITVLNSKELKTSFYAVYGAIAVTDVIMGSAYVATAIKRIYRQISNIGEVMDRWRCCQESSVLYFSQTLGLYMAFALAVNRTFSTLKLVITKSIDRNYRATYLVIAIALVMSSFETGYMMVQGWHHENMLLSCGTASCWVAFSYRITLFCHLGISFFVVLMNLILIIIIHCFLKLKNNHLERRVSKVLTAMVFSHATSHIASRLGLLIMMHNKQDDPELTTIGLALRNLVVINAALHFFIFYFTSSEFQKAVDKVIFKKPRTTGPIHRNVGRRLSVYKLNS